MQNNDSPPDDMLLENRLTEIEDVLRNFDRLLEKRMSSVIQVLIKMIGNHAAISRRNSAGTPFENLTAPMLNETFSGMLEHPENRMAGPHSQTGADRGTALRPFRVSQGQIWAQAAVAVARAMRRNL